VINLIFNFFIMATPAKGKKYVKVVKNPKTGRKKKVSY
jgi:hypothetical protein